MPLPKWHTDTERLARIPHIQPSAGALRTSLATTLHGEVSGMSPDNFMVRAHLQHVERFRNESSWEALSDSDIHCIDFNIAGLPSQIETDEIEARFFDLTGLRMRSVELVIVQLTAINEENGRKRLAFPVSFPSPSSRSFSLPKPPGATAPPCLNRKGHAPRSTTATILVSREAGCRKVSKVCVHGVESPENKKALKHCGSGL
jgi:hypothetical protein